MGRRRRDGDADDEMDWRRDGDGDDALLLPCYCRCSMSAVDCGDGQIGCRRRRPDGSVTTRWRLCCCRWPDALRLLTAADYGDAEMCQRRRVDGRETEPRQWEERLK
ncbi:hypothetical protein ACLOJK_018536 [Asimina triloba]